MILLSLFALLVVVNMKNIIIALFITVLLIPNILHAEDTFEGFAARVESWAEGLNGYVVTDNGATIDLGKNANVVSGMEFTTTRNGEKLIHPVTGKSLGVKKITTGVISILNVEDKYSTTKIINNNGIKKGDAVNHVFPLPVKFATNLMQDNEVAQMKYALFQSKSVIEDSSSNYTVTCARENSGANKAKCSLNFNGKVIFSDEIPVKGMKIISTSDNSKNKPIKVNNQVYSLAVGFFLGKDDTYLTAVTDRSSVTFYEIGNDKLIEKYSLSSFPGEIVNIEAVDINNNGKDELIVSILDKKFNAVSQIYEHDGKAFVRLKEKVPYLFRSYFTEGKKHLVCQTYSEGTMIGMIYNVTYDEKKGYEYDSPQSMSFGASIYGYGVYNDNILYYNRHGLLNKNINEESTTYDNIEFGNTVNYIIYSEKLDTGVNVGNTGESAGFFVYDEKNIVVPVYQRIIQFKDGSILISSNKLAKNNVMGQYNGTSIGSYFLTTKIVQSWNTQLNAAAVSDFDILSDGSTVVYAFSKNKNGLDDIFIDFIEAAAF